MRTQLGGIGILSNAKEAKRKSRHQTFAMSWEEVGEEAESDAYPKQGC